MIYYKHMPKGPEVWGWGPKIFLGGMGYFGTWGGFHKMAAWREMSWGDKDQKNSPAFGGRKSMILPPSAEKSCLRGGCQYYINFLPGGGGVFLPR